MATEYYRPEAMKEVDNFKQEMLNRELSKCTPEQQAFFQRCFPKGVTTDREFETAIGLIERTLIKNSKQST